MASSVLIVVARYSDFNVFASSICPAKGMSLSVLSAVITISDEDRAAKQSEVNLLMDEVERAQTRLLTLEREKVHFPNPTCIFKRIQLVFNPSKNKSKVFFFFFLIRIFVGPKGRGNRRFKLIIDLRFMGVVPADWATLWGQKIYLSMNSFT